MEFSSVSHFDKRKKADILVLPYWKAAKHPVEAADTSFLSSFLSPILATGDFQGKEGETLFLYAEGQPEKRIALLGLGSKDHVSVETIRRSYGSLAKICLGKKLSKLNIVIPVIPHIKEVDVSRGMSEGILLPNYLFDRMKHRSPEENGESELIESVGLIGGGKEAAEAADKTNAICDGVFYARDLTNGNADDVTPQYLVHCAKGLAKEQPKIKTTIFDKKRIEKEKMALLLAVNRGSALDPAFIIMEYRGNPKSKDHTVLVGKGITYDTGGLNIKVSGMEIMKCDMGGAAAVFGTLLAVSNLGLKVNVTGVVPTTENCTDAKSFKPGDVYQSYLGKTVEMTNSDAEGRLILADAIAYAVAKLKPTRIIDLATLTGAIEVALGSEATGLMSNNDALANKLIESGERTFERMWRMPLYDEYKEKLKSDIADLKSWNGRSAASSVAATFIRAFVDENIPWAHLDIASTAYLTEPKKYLPKNGTGVGVRLLVDFLEHLGT